MIEKLAILYSDTYKQCHPRMYPKGLTRLVSYWTPRRSMFGEDDTMIFFGLQGFLEGFFIKNFLISSTIFPIKTLKKYLQKF